MWFTESGASIEEGQEPEISLGSTGILKGHIVAFRQCIESASAFGSVRVDRYSPFNPEELKVGEAVTLGISITNTSDEARSFSAGATVWHVGKTENLDGDYRTDFDTPLEPGQSASLKWNHPLTSIGSYHVMFTVWDEGDDAVLLRVPCPSERLISAYSPSAPKITGIEPAQPRANASRQWITIAGEEFTEQSSVILSILGNSYPISEDRTEFVSTENLRMQVGLTDPGTWSAQVVNAGDERSNLFEFKVLP